MINPTKNQIYFCFAYEDESRQVPVIYTYQYIGLSDSTPQKYVFRFVGEDAELELAGDQLGLLSDATKIAREIELWASENSDLAEH